MNSYYIYRRHAVWLTIIIHVPNQNENPLYELDKLINYHFLILKKNMQTAL